MRQGGLTVSWGRQLATWHLHALCPPRRNGGRQRCDPLIHSLGMNRVDTSFATSSLLDFTVVVLATPAAEDTTDPSLTAACRGTAVLAPQARSDAAAN